MDERTSAADETLARITELARQALQAQAALARQSLELGRATLSGEVDRATTGRAYLDVVSREGARYWREVGALGLDYAGELMALGSRTAARIISDTAAAAARPTGRRDRHRPRGSAGADGSEDGPEQEPVPAEAPARAVAVTLRAAVGDVARATVTVANRHPRARRVTLTASELKDPAGDRVPVVLTVDPGRVTIPAGKEHQVRLGADLDASVVHPGDRYVGTVEVSGGDEATVAVTVEVAD